MPPGSGDASEDEERVPARSASDSDGSGSVARTARHPPGSPEATATTARTAIRTPIGGGVVQVVHGAKRVDLAAQELQRAAVGLVELMVKPPTAAIEPAADSLESAKLAGGVTYRVLYDRRALAHPAQLEITTRMVALGEQAKVVHVAPAKLVMVDNEVAMLPLTMHEHIVDSALVIRSSELLVSIKRVFDDLWRFAAPFTTAPQSRLGTVQPSEQERWILSLLASGATDDAIGRLMGFSARTAHRRVRELISRLGVETRFQAGMRAVQLGWL